MNLPPPVADPPAASTSAAPSGAAAPAPPSEMIGVGSPLVDLVVQVDDDFLASHVSGAKGGMEMVDAAVISELIGKLTRPPQQSPGGSAANTTVGCAHLGVRAAFIGACGADAYGEFYRSALREQNCDPRLVVQQELPTGQVLSMVTPDTERTMRTCLGAAGALSPEHFTPALFAGARVVVLEGYILFSHALTRAVVAAARQAGCRIALDLASFEVVNANRAMITELLAGGIDILFANSDEAAAWNPAGPEAALEEFARQVAVVAVKLGKDGALIASGTERVRVAAETVQAIDTTGAGDSWAAGFLAGYLRGLSLRQCGRLGSLSGAAVVQVMGAQLPRQSWLGVKGYLDAWS
jgi:sugar/nucleoside kinase (ribokinase family)